MGLQPWHPLKGTYSLLPAALLLQPCIPRVCNAPLSFTYPLISCSVVMLSVHSFNWEIRDICALVLNRIHMFHVPKIKFFLL